MNILLTILKVYLLIGVITMSIALGIMLITLLAVSAFLLFIHRDPVYLEEEKQEDWTFVRNSIEGVKPNSIRKCIKMYLINGILLWPREIYLCIKSIRLKRLFKTTFNKED